MCKHVLATKLAEAMNLCDAKNIEDNDFAPLMLSSKMHQQKYELASAKQQVG